MLVNALGQPLVTTDRNGNTHTLTYDILGRVVSDAVTTLGSGVDGAVRRVETAYDSQGNAYLLTNYDAASGGNIVTQVQRTYDGLGQLVTEYQSHGGAVNTGSTPRVQYAYSTLDSNNRSRLTSVTYPNGRVITYNYATGLDSTISRLSSISDGGTTLESYSYLGYGTVVSRAHPQPSVDLSYVKVSGESNGDAGDQYTGLDRFGRIVDQRWRTGSTNKDRLTYTYDRNGNRTAKTNTLSSSYSEVYTYDSLNQLSSFNRNSGARTQSWDYDALGNWDSVTTNGTAQTRTANRQNEITSVSGATTPTYDANGNMTKDETGKQFTFDAWNRLKVVKDSGGTTLKTYGYDALNRRVTETVGGTTTDLYYSSGWQVLEERVGGTARVSYVWSPVYVDAMIARDRDSDANGSLEERLYALHDANFNVTGLVNTSGTVVERYAYDPFGAVTYLNASWGTISSSAYDWRHLHQGGRLDSSSGFYHFRNRDYSPSLGRWASMDPIGFEAGDVDLYRYVSNHPVGHMDPLGLHGLPRTAPRGQKSGTFKSRDINGVYNINVDQNSYNILESKYRKKFPDLQYVSELSTGRIGAAFEYTDKHSGKPCGKDGSGERFWVQLMAINSDEGYNKFNDRLEPLPALDEWHPDGGLSSTTQPYLDSPSIDFRGRYDTQFTFLLGIACRKKNDYTTVLPDLIDALTVAVHFKAHGTTARIADIELFRFYDHRVEVQPHKTYTKLSSVYPGDGWIKPLNKWYNKENYPYIMVPKDF